MQAYGSSRLTKDVDLMVSQVPSFAKKGARLNVGGRSVEIAGVPFDFIDRGDEYRDLYDAAIDSAKKVTGFDIPVVTPEFLVAMKMVAARPKDLADLDFLLSSVKLNTKLLQKIVLQHLGKYAVTDLHNRAQTARWLKSQGRLD